ncbi:MAG: amino acid--[acyl-carrier-protein] ligase [Sphingomicrobium sp.]
MAKFREATSEEAAFLASLLEHGLLIESDVPGVYGYNAVFVDIFERLDGLITRHAEVDRAESIRFPPVLPKTTMESCGYLASFPHLGASLFGFEGSESHAAELAETAANHGPWPHQVQTDLVMTPAACYPVYPAIARRGPLAPDGICIDAGAAMVFRNEPSGDPARMQIFRQRELVRIAEPDTVAEWRNSWRDRAMRIFQSLELEPKLDVASDPFFGHSGRLLSASQREQALKFEILVQIASPQPTALASFNYHQDHFTRVHGISMSDSSPAHTACLGFGMERCTLALLRKHGLDPVLWPSSVRLELWQ